MLLTDLGLHIDWIDSRTFVLLRDIAEIVVDNKDLWEFDLRSHTTTRYIFLENYAIDILALLLILVQNRDDFDERVEIDRVSKHSRGWPDGHDRMLRAVGKDLAPFLLVDTVVLNHLINHAIKMAAKLVIDPVVGALICHFIARGATLIPLKLLLAVVIQEVCHGTLV